MRARLHKPQSDNLSTQNYLRRSKVIPKFVKNKPGDVHEQEADNAAGEIVKNAPSTNSLSPTGTGVVQAKPLSQTLTPRVQLKEEEDVQLKEAEVAEVGMADPIDEEDPIRAQEVQAKEEEGVQLQEDFVGSQETTVPDLSLQSTEGMGTSLPSDTLTEMNAGFGADFSGVKIHTDTQAETMNQSLGAQAFTHEKDVYFNSNTFNPSTDSGKFLLAHELAHTIQQGAAAPTKEEEETKKELHPQDISEAKAKENPEMEAKGKELAVALIDEEKEQPFMVSSKEEKVPEQPINQEIVVPNAVEKDENAETDETKGAKKEKEKSSPDETKVTHSSLTDDRGTESLLQEASESKVEQTELSTSESVESIQQDSIELESNENEQSNTQEATIQDNAQESLGESQLEDEIENNLPAEQVSKTPEEESNSLTELKDDPIQEPDSEASETTEQVGEVTLQGDAEQESTTENVSDLANETIIRLEDLEKSHADSLTAYRKITQKNIRTLSQQSEKALQSCDSTYYQQVSLIENGYGNAIRKVKKALSTTLSDLSKGKSARRKKLASIVESKVKKTGYLTWKKQQQAEGMGREFAGKTWTYTTELKNDSNKKAYDQKQEIKANGADAKRKYINHKYKPDVDEAVDESVLDYCESINESTADLKATLNEDAGGMATNFKNEAVDLKALLPQGKQRVIQNIQAIGREGAKEFNKVDQDVLPTLRKQMYAAEAELHQARKQAFIALKNAWMQSRQGIKEQQKQLELKLRTSEKQAVAENTQVMAEVRAEYSQDPTMESQLGEMDTQMKKSPGELAAAQQNLLKQGGVERQKGLRLARQGMTMLGSGSVKQAQKMADTALKGAAKMKTGALKGYDQVVKGTENGMNEELSRYEQALDKIIGDARSDWRKKLGEGKWGMRKKAHGVWYENGKLRKESRSELFAVAKDASQVDFWDVLEAIGYFLLGVLAVLALILAVVAVVWLIGALMGYLAGVFLAFFGETLLGAIFSLLGTLLQAGIMWLLQSTVFWVAASAYGIYTGIDRINAAKNNPNLTRNQTAYEYGFGTGEIVTSLLPAWFKFKGKIKSKPPKSTSKPNYQNHGGEFEDDFARMGTQQEPPVNKPSGSNKTVKDVDDFAGNRKSDKFVEEGSLEKTVAERAIGMTDDAAMFAAQSSRADHAMRHLIDQGVIEGAKNSNLARKGWNNLVSDVLTNPTKTFDYFLQGAKTKGFYKVIDGKRVVLFVTMHNHGSVLQGQVIGGWVPTNLVNPDIIKIIGN